jgi:hypothetical protein
MKSSLRLTIITSLLAASGLSAATLMVGPGGFSTIQQAVDAAGAGDEIVVTNGTYATGTASGGGYTLQNRVAVTKPLTVRSVNGPQVTIIRGYQDPDPYEYAMLRYVYLTNGASLSGFTLTGGGTYDRVGALPPGAKSGGGVFCESASATLSNCVLTGNRGLDCGGAYGGTLNNCKLANNSGGGALNSTLNNCSLTGNAGGGAIRSTLTNCLLTGNSSSGVGGGANLCTLVNCTVIGNSASDSGGGVAGCNLFNCIVYFNTATRQGPNYYLNSPSDTLNYCCTIPLPTSGSGNITAPPFFVDQAGGNLRLRAGPCINGGNNAFVAGGMDLDGRPRIVGGTVDIGAYESQTSVSGAFIGYLERYGLPTDGSADHTDPDLDGMDNWQEWVCGTDPNNALSVLRLLSVTPGGANVVATWQSVAGMNYFLTRSPNLAWAFTLVATNIIGQEYTTSYADTNATGAGPLFYRVGVRSP